MARKLRAPWLGRERNQPNVYIYWYEQDTGRVRRRSTGTGDDGEAQAALGRFLIERAHGQTHANAIKTADRYPIVTALRWYAQEKAEALASASFTGYAIDYLVRFFGARAQVSSITPQRLIEYEKWRGVKPGTVRRELGVLAAALNHAVKNGRLTSAPKIVLPKAGAAKDRYLSNEEIGWVLRGCAEDHVRLFVLLALNTGARKGAILDLRWPQVDLINRLIYLNPPDREQTAKRRATVPMNDLLHAELMRQHDKARKAVPAAARGRAPCPYVVAFRGQPVLNVKKGFHAACRRAEGLFAEWLAQIEHEDPARFAIEQRRLEKQPFSLRGVTPHTLRHTAGTLMAQGGIDLFMIAKMLGHSVAKTTELYAHHKPDYLRPAAEILGRATTESIR